MRDFCSNTGYEHFDNEWDFPINFNHIDEWFQIKAKTFRMLIKFVWKMWSMRRVHERSKAESIACSNNRVVSMEEKTPNNENRFRLKWTPVFDGNNRSVHHVIYESHLFNLPTRVIFVWLSWAFLLQFMIRINIPLFLAVHVITSRKIMQNCGQFKTKKMFSKMEYLLAFSEFKPPRSDQEPNSQCVGYVCLTDLDFQSHI